MIHNCLDLLDFCWRSEQPNQTWSQFFFVGCFGRRGISGAPVHAWMPCLGFEGHVEDFNSKHQFWGQSISHRIHGTTGIFMLHEKHKKSSKCSWIYLDPMGLSAWRMGVSIFQFESVKSFNRLVERREMSWGVINTTNMYYFFLLAETAVRCLPPFINRQIWASLGARRPGMVMMEKMDMMWQVLRVSG